MSVREDIYRESGDLELTFTKPYEKSWAKASKSCRYSFDEAPLDSDLVHEKPPTMSIQTNQQIATTRAT